MLKPASGFGQGEETVPGPPIAVSLQGLPPTQLEPNCDTGPSPAWFECAGPALPSAAKAMLRIWYFEVVRSPVHWPGGKWHQSTLASDAANKSTAAPNSIEKNTSLLTSPPL